MKRFLLGVCLALVSYIAKPQMVNYGSEIVVSVNSKLALGTDYRSENNSILMINGELSIKGDFKNNSGTIESSGGGILKFSGQTTQKIECPVST